MHSKHTHTHMHTHTHTHTHTQTHTHTHTHTHIHTNTHTHKHIHTYAHTTHAHIHTHAHTYTHATNCKHAHFKTLGSHMAHASPFVYCPAGFAVFKHLNVGKSLLLTPLLDNCTPAASREKTFGARARRQRTSFAPGLFGEKEEVNPKMLGEGKRSGSTLLQHAAQCVAMEGVVDTKVGSYHSSRHQWLEHTYRETCDSSLGESISLQGKHHTPFCKHELDYIIYILTTQLQQFLKMHAY